MKVCEDCGSRVYKLGCVNCNEEAYIAAGNEEQDDSDCWKCKGSGEIEWDDDACSMPAIVMCWVCKGTGERP